MTITIVSVGSRPKHEIATLIDDYLKRLPRHIRVVWQFVKHGSGDPQSSVKTESENIMRIINNDGIVILLDEIGQNLTSPEFSELLFSDSQDVTIVIGGAYGVSDEVKARADVLCAFGRVVYPHQIVRLILSEQIYRAYTIHSGHPYHHN